MTNLASLEKSRAWILPWVCLIFISVSQMGSGKGLPEGKHQSLVSCGSTSSAICSTHSRWTLVAVSLAAIPPADIFPENGCMHAIGMSFPEGHATVPPPSSSYILSALSHTMNNNSLCPPLHLASPATSHIAHPLLASQTII